MPQFQFRPNVRYRNEQKLDGSYGHIHVPSGVSARMPIFVSAEQMQELAPANTIKIIAGLTVTDFSLKFSNPSQWTQVRLGNGVLLWQFTGGPVILDILISVYVAQGFNNKTIALILEHEFLHVQDEIDIVSKFMPKAALKDQYVDKYLTRGQDLDDSMYQNWFKGTMFSKWVHDNVWVPEHDKRGEARDSGAQWNSYRQRIADLQRTSH